jgi:hypothetical protein
MGLASPTRIRRHRERFAALPTGWAGIFRSALMAGHVDALAILAEAGTSPAASETTHGVRAAGQGGQSRISGKTAGTWRGETGMAGGALRPFRR